MKTRMVQSSLAVSRSGTRRTHEGASFLLNPGSRLTFCVQTTDAEMECGDRTSNTRFYGKMGNP